MLNSISRLFSTYPPIGEIIPIKYWRLSIWNLPQAAWAWWT